MRQGREENTRKFGGGKAKARRGRGWGNCDPVRAQDMMGTGHWNSPTRAQGDLGPFDCGPAAGGSHRFGLDHVAQLSAGVGLLGFLLPQGSLTLLALGRGFSLLWIYQVTL